MPEVDKHLPICWFSCDSTGLNWAVDHGALFFIVVVWIVAWFATKVKRA